MEFNSDSTSLESKGRTGLEQSKLLICCKVPGGPEKESRIWWVSIAVWALLAPGGMRPWPFGHIEVSLLPGGSQPLVLVQHSLFHPRAEPKVEKGLMEPPKMRCGQDPALRTICSEQGSRLWAHHSFWLNLAAGTSASKFRVWGGGFWLGSASILSQGLKRMCAYPSNCHSGRGAASSCILGFPQMGTQMLGSPSDQNELSHHFMQSIFSLSTPQKGPISWSQFLMQQLLYLRVPDSVLGIRTKEVGIIFYWGRD